MDMYFKQNVLISIIQTYLRWAKPFMKHLTVSLHLTDLGANETGFNLIIFGFNIR